MGNASPTLSAEQWYQQGVALRAKGDMQGAIRSFNEALKSRPDFAEACFALATTVEDSGTPDIALKTYQYLLAIAPNHAEGRARMAGLLALLQQLSKPFLEGVARYNSGDREGAVICFRQSLAIHPRVPDTLSNLALALYQLRRFDESLAAADEALRLQPAHTGALSTRGNIFQSTGRDNEAIAVYRQIIALKPDDTRAWANIGKVLQRREDDAGAAEAYENALTIDPRHAETLAELTYRLHRLCRWDRATQTKAALIEVLKTTQQSVSPFLATLFCDPKLQYDNARRYSKAHHGGGKAYDGKRPLPADARGDGKLRIGYLSADYYQHATAYLISELFENHDKNRFEIYAYSCGVGEASPEQARIRKAVTWFRDIRALDNRSAAQTIERDGIDILIDLKGYTKNERLGVMALRPAPIQMHYLGYPGTTGANFIDYFIADSITAPEGADVFFAEKLIRLSGCYQVNDRKRPLPEAPAKTSYGLPENAFVFADFNNAYKITPDLFAVWMRLLQAVPGSVLWLLETHAEAKANMRNVAQQHGIEPKRIIGAPKLPQAKHLARYRHIDLFLDTSPVCGHTTMSDALWCGVPVVALKGDSFVSRVAESLLHAVELPELVAKDLPAYEALALRLAGDAKEREHIRRHLEDGRMRFPLFNSKATTRSLENAYQQATERHRKGLRVKALTVQADNV